MPSANVGNNAVAVDGRIYVIGDSVEMYNPLTDTWTLEASAPTKRSTNFGIGVIHNKIYCIGGQTAGVGSESTGTNEVYDTATDIWSTKTPMPTPRIVTVVHVINNKIYLIGGEVKAAGEVRASSIVAANEMYDPETDTWVTKTSLPTLRLALCSYAVEGKIYVIGGRSVDGSLFNTNEVYDPATDTWATKTPMPTSDECYLSCVLDRIIYVFGQNATYVYNTETNTWSNGASIPTYQFGRTIATSGVNAPKKIYVIGGYTDPYENSAFCRKTNLTQIYDPATDSWSLGSSMPTARASLCIVNLNDVFYALGGGDIIGGYILSSFNVNERYLPVGYGNPDPSYVPKIAVQSPLDKTYTQVDVALNFTVDKAVSWIGYSLDGQDNVTVTGNTTLSGLPVGSHYVTVYALDASGNTAVSDIIHFSIAAETFPLVTAVFGVGAFLVVAIAVGTFCLLKRKRNKRVSLGG
jgi:N-acetylneuraminic acid mutarotase